MKRSIFVAIVAMALLGLMAGVAFAEGLGMDGYPGAGAGTVPGEYLIQGKGSGGLYRIPSGSPHGNFGLTSHNCEVCHSVHWAQADGQALLMDTVANACIYCHVDPGNAGYTKLYGGSADNYDGTSPTFNTAALDYGHQAPNAKCGDCHQVHAATAQMVGGSYMDAGATATKVDFLVEKILRVDGTGSDLLNSKREVLKFTDADNAVGAEQLAVSKWCTRCHAKKLNGVGYFNQGYGTQAHVMTVATTNYSSPTYLSGPIGRIAENDSTTCYNCHSSAEVAVTTPGTPHDSTFNFPHYSDGVRFLKTVGGAPATDSHADGVCLNCHQGGATMSGGVGAGW